jgi:phenylacetate-CoA ligase
MYRYTVTEIEQLPRRKLRELQMERLLWQVRRCFDKSPFYMELYEQAGINPYKMKTMDDFTHFPFVTKDMLRKEQILYPPFGRHVEGIPWCEVHPSTGSTGSPIMMGWSRNDVNELRNFTRRMLISTGIGKEDIILNAYSYGLRMGAQMVHSAAMDIGCSVIPISNIDIDTVEDYLLNLQPTVLFAMPSYALRLANDLKDKDISPDFIQLTKGIFGGEPGIHNLGTRTKLEELLGISAFDHYGLTEVGPIAGECMAKEGIHWAEDLALVELYNPDTYEPVLPGETGVLVITDLTKEFFPMIRFWTSDIATLDETPCRCGRTHIRSPHGIMGRLDDLIIFREKKFYPNQVEIILHGIEAVSDSFKIVISRNDKTFIQECTIMVEIYDYAREDHVSQQLQQAFEKKLGFRPGIEFVPVGKIETPYISKKRYVIERR